MITELEGGMTSIFQLMRMSSMPQNSVTPGWGTTFLTTERERGREGERERERERERRKNENLSQVK